MRNTLTSHPATLALAVFLLASAGLWTYSSATHAQDSAKSPRPALTVQTAPPQRTAMTQRLAANGNVAAWQEASIGAESNGLRLTDVRVNVGDSVKAGQVLATFAAEMVQADVAQARASLLEAKAHAAEAASNAERARTLQASGALSAQQIEQYTTAAQAAQARVEAAQALLQAQQLRLQHTQVRAPDHGVISARSATVGAVVPAGTELFRLVRQGRLEWRAEVVGQDLARIRSGQRVQVTSNAGTVVEGTVRSVAPTLDPAKRVALVYVDLPGGTDNGGLKAGMYASGQFILGEADGWLVPQTAVVSRDGFNYVFAVSPQGRVLQRKVSLGARQGELVQVLEGVDGEMPLVRAGAGFLNDGDIVRVTRAPAVAASAASAPASAASQP